MKSSTYASSLLYPFIPEAYPLRIITQHHAASCNITQHHAASRSITQHHAASRSITQHHAASRSITQYHAVSRSTMHYHTAPRTTTHHHTALRSPYVFIILFFFFINNYISICNCIRVPSQQSLSSTDLSSYFDCIQPLLPPSLVPSLPISLHHLITTGNLRR